MNKEDCIIDAFKYKTKTEWFKNSNKAYNIARKNNWIADCCKHMIKPEIWNKKWNKETCIIEAKKYTNKKDFQKKSAGASDAAYSNNWIDEICSHMEVLGNLRKRCIYVYEFSDNFAYVGLTYNFNARDLSRKLNKKDSVTKHITSTNIIPKHIQLSDYIPIEEASLLENKYIEEYRKAGWIMLNKAKGGGLGGNLIIWTYDACKKEALKYEYKKDFKKYSSSAYRISFKKGWFELITGHMKNKNVKWSFEKCKEIALKYETKHDFRNIEFKAYNIASLNKWIDIICQHMTSRKKSNKYWTKERCINEALKYDNRKEFREKSSSAYATIVKNDWLCYIVNQNMYIH